jgi:hypothetical protein
MDERPKAALRHVGLALLLCASAGFAGPADAEDQHIFVLSPTVGAALLAQCSRPAPQDVDGFWSPTSEQIAELETLLGPYLKSVPLGRSLLPLERYHRQYVGFVKGGKLFIYGSFYAYAVEARREPTEPIIVCDGGRSFWGIVYSVESKELMELAVNGVA